MPRTRNQISYYIFAALKSLIFSLILTILLCLALGYKFILVNGWSSEPVLKYQSLIMIHKVDATELQVGDYVTFSSTGEGMITHRIISIDLENDVIVCSANHYNSETGEIEDTGAPQTLKYENILGKVVKSNYYIGRVAFIVRSTIRMLQNQPWILIALMGSFVLVLYIKEKCKTTPEFF